MLGVQTVWLLPIVRIDSDTTDNLRFLTLTAFVGIDSGKFWIISAGFEQLLRRTDAEPVGEKYFRPGQ